MSGRRLRSSLLAMAVGFAAALIVGVACAVTSLNEGLNDRVVATIGAADASLKHIGGRPIDPGLLATVRSWPEVEDVAPKRYGSLPLRSPADGRRILAYGTGIDPEAESRIRTARLLAGRQVAADGEVVIQPKIAEALGVGVGDVVEVERFGEPLRLTVVGVAAPPAFSMLMNRPLAVATMRTVGEATGEPERLDEASIALRAGADARLFVNARGPELPEGIVLEPSARITSGLDDNLRSSNIALSIVSVFAFLGASFIILTGLTTSVVERERELAIVRCLGGTRGQIAAGQLLVGVLLGGLGALIGVPLGVGLAWAASRLYEEHFTSGLVVAPLGLALSTFGSLGAGLLGAAWPAWQASRLAPLEALAVRARAVRPGVLALVTLLGALLAGAQPAVLFSVDDGQVKYWSYVTFGAPLLFLGYFLLATGVTAGLARLIGPLVAGLLRVPRTLLSESIGAAPYRHGFTAGSLMAGLALMTVLWTQGTALLRDWLGAIRFPDAFIHGLAGLTDEDRAAVAALPVVTDTVAVGLQRIPEATFGVRAIRRIGTTFVGFEPRPFFRMAKLEWIEGEQERAIERLEQGGAVLVSREFRVARGLGVGDTFTIHWKGEDLGFEIVGVISSPGLDIASKFFDISSEYREQSLHAVVGSRQDLIEKFGNDAIKLIQLELADDVPDEEALRQIREALKGKLIVAGSGREIMAGINALGERSMRAMTTVAVVAMLIACFGVANIVVAGIDARRYELGVLRAVGGTGGLLARLVIGETLLVALAACVLGTALGIQASFNGLELYRALAGLELHLRPPPLPILAGWGILTVLALAAAAPAVAALARQTPRELLGSTRG